MKRLLFTLFILTYTAISYGQTVGDTVISNNPAKLKLRILYFHITNRCNTCTSIELNLRKTLFGEFAKEIENGVIDISILNCELPENQELVKKYEAYGATLAYTVYMDGKELQTEDLSNWAFQKVHKPELFASELKDKIVQLIK